ncbi:RloB-like protein [Paraburkholderia eburnea]|uniref:RloB-like protein n=1 Tax=Paraburkholderia eburnea TaxID=1189126 RepID=A0A2S4LWA9_9BURK|nr:RloB domain-containing protein [Paraburkholderia eburnea]POR46731.1 RloB-like protein [Paraburkholderia eburnea]PRZ17920.1 RloB-like protein [Paraburkholderia eburnea]
MPKQKIAIRHRVFIGCEGESERSYVALLQQLMGLRTRHHLIPELLNGGDHLANIESAKKALRKHNEQGRGKFVAKYVLLDSDQRGRNAQHDAECDRLARENDFRLIWQDPCHEALLLRHLDRCSNRRPPTTPVSEQQLVAEWPEYQKNFGRDNLGTRIDINALERVRRVEPVLGELLVLVGLVPN